MNEIQEAGEPKEAEKKGEEEEEDVRELNPWIPFECSVCGMRENTLHGQLSASDGHFSSAVFFMRDPFVPYTRMRARKPVLTDFLVLGQACSLCDRSVCIDKTCSVFFGSRFCAFCVTRERRRFPDKVVEMILKAQAQTQSTNKSS